MPTRKKPRTIAASNAALDSLVDFGFVSTQIFAPTRGRAFGITRNGLDLMVERGDFPKPIKLGPAKKASVRWRLNDLRRWIESRAQAA